MRKSVPCAVQIIPEELKTSNRRGKPAKWLRSEWIRSSPLRDAGESSAENKNKEMFKIAQQATLAEPTVWESSEFRLSERCSMYPATANLYPHRFNPDGSYDSICTVCLITIASVSVESELARHEREHSCNPVRLYQLGKYPPLPPASYSRKPRMQTML